MARKLRAIHCNTREEINIEREVRGPGEEGEEISESMEPYHKIIIKKIWQEARCISFECTAQEIGWMAERPYWMWRSDLLGTLMSLP